METLSQDATAVRRTTDPAAPTGRSGLRVALAIAALALGGFAIGTTEFVTMGLLPGSPCIDAGDNTGAADFDQRGQTRVVGGAIDRGAYEVQNFLVTTTSDNGPGSLRNALADTNKAGGSLLTFSVAGIC